MLTFYWELSGKVPFRSSNVPLMPFKPIFISVPHFILHLEPSNWDKATGFVDTETKLVNLMADDIIFITNGFSSTLRLYYFIKLETVGAFE